LKFFRRWKVDDNEKVKEPAGALQGQLGAAVAVPIDRQANLENTDDELGPIQAAGRRLSGGVRAETGAGGDGPKNSGNYEDSAGLRAGTRTGSKAVPEDRPPVPEWVVEQLREKLTAPLEARIATLEALLDKHGIREHDGL
jgi:hypothetical protein